MTSRERVCAALRHEPTDRVPIDFGAMRSTGIMAMAYNRLTPHLGLDEDTLVYDVVQQLAQPSDAVLDRFGVDVVDLGRAFLHRARGLGGVDAARRLAGEGPALPSLPEPDGAGGRQTPSADGTVFGGMPAGPPTSRSATGRWRSSAPQRARRPRRARTKVTWMALPSPPWHLDITTDEGLARCVTEPALYKTTDRAVMVAFGGNFLEGGQFLCGMARFLEMLAGEPDLAEAVMDKLLEGYMQVLPRFLEAVGPYVQLIQVGDDLGTQTGPQISPDMYRRLIKPRHRIVYSYIRERFDGFLFLHSCGSLREILPDLIDVGVQVINPVQTSATGMDPAELKREFGRDLSFWGAGCETQTTLREGIALYKGRDPGPVTAEEVAACAPQAAEAELDALVDLAAEGQAQKLAVELRRLGARGATPVSLAIAAGRHFRALHAAAAAPDGPDAALGRQRPPVFGPRRARMAGQARAFGQGRLETALGLITETDLALRSGGSLPGLAVVERMLVRVAMLRRG